MARVARVLAELRATAGDREPEREISGPLDAALEILRLGLAPQETFDAFLKVAMAYVGSHVNQVFRIEGSELRLAAELFAEPRSAIRYEVASWDGVIGRAARSNEAVWVPDIAKDAGYIAAESSTRAELAIPIRDTHTRRVAGVVNIELPGPVSLTGDDVAWTVSLVEPLSAMLPTTEPRTMACGYLADPETVRRIVEAVSAEGIQCVVVAADAVPTVNVADTLVVLVGTRILSESAPPLRLLRPQRFARLVVASLDAAAEPMSTRTFGGIAGIDIVVLDPGVEGAVRTLLELLAPTPRAPRPEAAPESIESETPRLPNEESPASGLERPGGYPNLTMNVEPDGDGFFLFSVFSPHGEGEDRFGRRYQGAVAGEIRAAHELGAG